MTHLYPGYIAGVLTLLLAMATAGLYGTASSAQAPEVESLLLGPADFPREAKTLVAGPVDVGSISHPLHQADFVEPAVSVRRERKPALYEYTEAHVYSAVIPGDAIVVIGNWLYTYPSAEQAADAIDIVMADLIAAKAEPLGEYTSGARTIKGQVYYMEGQDADAVYWFVGVSGSNLFMVLANGLDPEATQAELEPVLKVSLSD